LSSSIVIDSATRFALLILILDFVLRIPLGTAALDFGFLGAGVGEEASF
jgi:hypothetical protein